MEGYSFTLAQYFIDSCIQNKKEIFLRHANGEIITYEESLLRVAHTVQRLDEAGIQKGDRVVCYWEETVPAIFFTLACAVIGALPIPLSPVFSVRYLKNLIQQSEARAVFTTVDRLAQLEEEDLDAIAYSEGIAPDPVIFPLEETGNGIFDLAAERLKRRAAAIRPEDIFMIQTTSGSTGTPKLVVRTHLGPLRYARHVGAEIHHENGERPRFLMVAALTHAFGFHMFTTALSMGAELLVPNHIDTRADLQEVRDLDPTVLPMTPRVLRSFFLQYKRNLGGEKSGQAVFGKNARHLLVAGGAPDPEMFQSVQRQGLNVIEASLVALTRRGEWRPGCSGKKIPDVELKIAEDGELLVRSPGLMRGYYNDEASTRQAYSADGFFRTGDLGAVDADGSVRILGRKRDVFNTPEGSNIYPERLENLIETLPWARQVMLIGDRRPYLSALISVNPAKLQNLLPANTDDGYLKVERFRELYRRCGFDLERLNSQLERLDKVVRFALFQDPLHAAAYTSLQNGKVRRDRKKAQEAYQERIDHLYTAHNQLDASFVPGVDRRLRPHSDLKAHLVWAFKDRKKRLNPQIMASTQKIFQNICNDINVEILTEKLAADHIHLFISYPPEVPLKEIVQRMKNRVFAELGV